MKLFNKLRTVLTEAWAPYAVVDADGVTYWCWTWADALAWVAACDAQVFGTVSVWKGVFKLRLVAAQS